MALIREHLSERVESPIVKHSPIAVLVALLMLFHDHLSLTQITNHDSSLNQFVSDEMRRFVQAIALLVAFFLRDSLVDLREMDIPTRLLLALIPLGADFV